MGCRWETFCAGGGFGLDTFITGNSSAIDILVESQDTDMGLYGNTFITGQALADDHSTLYTSAGMQPQMPYFLGREAPPAPLTTTCQKVFRTPDIDEVGLDGYHLTFFEMLGNFSFGQYFKEGAIEYATEFIQQH